MQNFKHLLDLSDYPTSHPLFDPTNNNSFNNELYGALLEESVILRSKMYSIEFACGIKQSAKPVQKVLKKPREIPGMSSKRYQQPRANDKASFFQSSDQNYYNK